MRIKFYFALFVAFLIIAINHYAGLYDAYWLLPWFDIPMHILGGFMVGLFAQVGIDLLNHKKFDKRRVPLVLLAAFIVGIVWEFVEWYMGLTGGLAIISRVDTIKDMFNDLLGSVISLWVWKFLFNNTKK